MAPRSTHNRPSHRTTTHPRYHSWADFDATTRQTQTSSRSHTMSLANHMIHTRHFVPNIRPAHTFEPLHLRKACDCRRRYTLAIQQTYPYRIRTTASQTQRLKNSPTRSMDADTGRSTGGESTTTAANITIAMDGYAGETSNTRADPCFSCEAHHHAGRW